MSQNIEKHEFQSEARQVLELMINSVYSNPDIFLRELISNASDALDKLRIASLSKTELTDPAKEGEIRVVIDGKAMTLTVSDNGIGMDRDELVSYLGTIARSGTKEFIKAMQEAASSKNSDLIGQFGVGFYSSFIAADKVTVETKKAGSDKSWTWESEGEGTYTISEADRDTNGTSVTLHIKERDKDDESSKDYLSEWTLRSIIKQYSDFVTYPIYLEDRSKTDKEKEEPVNSMKALWTRPESEVGDDEYREFYRHLTHDWEDPIERISYKAEGSSEFRALLYIPSRPPVDLFFQDGKHGVQLYIRRVFIMNDCSELIPEYLRFIKGVVDSEDLSLNISREILQQDRQTAMIKNNITRKVLDALKKMKTDRPEEFKKFWQMFGMVLKEGIISDTKNREQIMKLCLLDSSGGEKTTLEEYVSRMSDGQKNIYYITGGPVKNLEISPKIEGFKKKNIEVLLLGDAVDEIWVNHARKFGDYEFVSVSQEDIALPEGSGFDSTEGREELEKTGFVSKLKESLADMVEDVKISTRLVDSPACFVQKGEPISPQMRNFFRSMGQEVPEEKKVLEVNPAHPLIKKIAAETEKGNADIAEWANVLMGLASICEGEPLEDGRKFTRILTKLLEK
jgi:molecular chaperone HtpG